MNQSAHSDKSCALCGCNLSNKPKSKEHIIPNSIGGRLKTSDFICKACNNTFGGSWDSKLAKQLNWFAHALAISRETGEPPRELVTTIEGKKYWLHADGSLSPEKSSYSEEQTPDGLKIHLVAKSIEEATQRLKGVAKKHPKLNAQKVLESLQVSTEYLNSPLHFTVDFGGPEAGRSLVKTAYAFAVACGIPSKKCEQAYRYLKYESPVQPYGDAYLSDPIQQRSEASLLHCVSLHGNPKSGRLWSYVEYFGLFRVVVLLSSEYSGPQINKVHAINPVDGAVTQKLRVKISESELNDILDGKGWTHEGYNAAADYAMPKILARNQERTFERVIEDGFLHARQTLQISDEAFPTSEQAQAFTALMMEKISPYLSNLVRNSRINSQRDAPN